MAIKSELVGAIGILFLFSIFYDSAARKLPSYVPVCKKSDPQFDQCVIEAVETVRPHLPKGIAKIRVPPIEPLHIPQLEINRDLDNLRVKASLKDIKVYGPSSFQIKKLKTNIGKLAIEATVNLPHVYVTSEYDVDGRLLVVPLKGKGLFKGNLTDIVADIRASADVATNSKGVKYLQIKTIQTKIRVGDQSVKFVNKDNNSNNALITETAAIFINQNRRQVLDIVTPIAEDTVVAFVRQIGNNILKSIPYSEILPE